MNKVFLIGNLSHTPKLSETPNGTAVCKFSIAVQRNFPNDKGEKVADFFNCTAWKGTAQNIAKYASKGSKVSIVGSIENRTYTDKNGNNRTTTEINVVEVEFLSAPKSKEDGMTEVETDELPF